MKQIALSEIKDDFSRFLREAASEQIVITRHGRPAGILRGFGSEDDWLDSVWSMTLVSSSESFAPAAAFRLGAVSASRI